MPCDDPVGRVQRAERVLEHHRHVAAVGQVCRRVRMRRQRPALVEDLAARRLVDPGQQPGDGALAAAALADQRDDLAARRSTRSASSTACRRAAREVAADLEVLGQAAGLEQRRRRPRRCRTGLRADVGVVGRRTPARRACSVQQAPRPTPARVERRARRRRSAANATGHRGWKRQPAGGCARSGGAPGIPVSRTRGPRMDGNASSSPRLYGCAGTSNTVPGRPDLDHLTRVHHQQPVGEVADQRHVVGDEDDRETRAAAAAP